MTLEIQHRPSESPYVERVWRSRSDDVAQMMATANPRWSLVFWEQSGQMYGAVQGPESKASPAPVPQYATFFGIDFALGTTMPHLPASRLVDGFADIPDASPTSFWFAGSAWRLPDYDNAEAFVRRLVHEGVLASDPIVADVVRTWGWQPAEPAGRVSRAVPDVSERTVQRRFLAATGLTRGAARQIDRARQAAILLREGEPPAEVVNRLGYFDQPHLAHSLTRFIGRTATSLRNDEPGEPLSLLYKT